MVIRHSQLCKEIIKTLLIVVVEETEQLITSVPQNSCYRKPSDVTFDGQRLVCCGRSVGQLSYVWFS